MKSEQEDFNLGVLWMITIVNRGALSSKGLRTTGVDVYVCVHMCVLGERSVSINGLTCEPSCHRCTSR